MLMLFLFNVFLLRSLLKAPQNIPYKFFFTLKAVLDVGERPEASGSHLEQGLHLIGFFFSKHLQDGRNKGDGDKSIVCMKPIQSKGFSILQASMLLQRSAS